jgi:hypothetical protein
VVCHQTVDVADPAVSLNNTPPPEDLKESRSVIIVQEDALSSLPATFDAIHRALAQWGSGLASQHLPTSGVVWRLGD